MWRCLVEGNVRARASVSLLTRRSSLYRSSPSLWMGQVAHLYLTGSQSLRKLRTHKHTLPLLSRFLTVS